MRWNLLLLLVLHLVSTSHDGVRLHPLLLLDSWLSTRCELSRVCTTLRVKVDAFIVKERRIVVMVILRRLHHVVVVAGVAAHLLLYLLLRHFIVHTPATRHLHHAVLLLLLLLLSGELNLLRGGGLQVVVRAV